ncbi:MAG: sigma-70 family RNA polymerase sigma factor [Streptosporangiaceae bacterium]
MNEILTFMTVPGLTYTTTVKHLPAFRLEGGLMAEPNLTAMQAVAPPAIETQSSEPGGFEEFFQASYRDLVRTAMYAGATRQQAEDAAAKTLTEMLPQWRTRQWSFAYARRAVLHNFIKDKTRGPERVARRLIERGFIPYEEGVEDSRLTAWEDDEWIAHLLSCLPPAQREVMEYIVRGLDRDEIAETLGKTKEAIRRHLCDARARLVRELHLNDQHEQPPAERRFPREEAR